MWTTTFPLISFDSVSMSQSDKTAAADENELLFSCLLFFYAIGE